MTRFVVVITLLLEQEYKIHGSSTLEIVAGIFPDVDYKLVLCTMLWKLKLYNSRTRIKTRCSILRAMMEMLTKQTCWQEYLFQDNVGVGLAGCSTVLHSTKFRIQPEDTSCSDGVQVRNVKIWWEQRQRQKQKRQRHIVFCWSTGEGFNCLMGKKLLAADFYSLS